MQSLIFKLLKLQHQKLGVGYSKQMESGIVHKIVFPHTLEQISTLQFFKLQYLETWTIDSIGEPPLFMARADNENTLWNTILK